MLLRMIAPSNQKTTKKSGKESRLVPFPSPILNFVYRCMFQGSANSHPATVSDKPKIKNQLYWKWQSRERAWAVEPPCQIQNHPPSKLMFYDIIQCLYCLVPIGQVFYYYHWKHSLPSTPILQCHLLQEHFTHISHVHSHVFDPEAFPTQ